MSTFELFLFATTAGFTASGIVANLYRISGVAAKTDRQRLLRSLVMVIAGPSVIFEIAIRGLVNKEWSRVSFWLAAFGLTYWSLFIGLFIMDIALVI
jgi:predicted permease